MANINIGGRLHSTATGNVVAGANEILDDTKGKKQSVINQETDEALAGKQAALVSGTNIKTVNGESILGSGNIQAGDPYAIKYSTQTLTDAQKTQARTNIGAYNKPGTGIPATDLASAAQTSLGKADTAYQKPQSGVPKSDLSSGVQSSLDLADTAVQAENVGPILPPPETDEFATKTQVTQLEAELNGLDLEITEDDVTSESGRWIDNSGIIGTATSSALHRAAAIDLTDCRVFSLTTDMSWAAENAAYLCDDSGNIFEIIQRATTDPTTVTDKTIPAGVTKLYVNFATGFTFASHKYGKVDRMDTDLHTVETDLAQTDTRVDNAFSGIRKLDESAFETAQVASVDEGKNWVNSSGTATISSNSNRNAYKFSVVPGKSYKITTWVNSSSAVVGFFADSDMSILSEISGDVAGTAMSKKEFIAPKDASFCLVNCEKTFEFSALLEPVPSYLGEKLGARIATETPYVFIFSDNDFLSGVQIGNTGGIVGYNNGICTKEIYDFVPGSAISYKTINSYRVGFAFYLDEKFIEKREYYTGSGDVPELSVAECNRVRIYVMPPSGSTTIPTLEDCGLEVSISASYKYVRAAAAGDSSYELPIVAPSPQKPADGTADSDFNAETLTPVELDAAFANLIATIQTPDESTFSNPKLGMQYSKVGRDATNTYDIKAYIFGKRNRFAWKVTDGLFAWANGGTTVFTDSISPRVGDIIYSSSIRTDSGNTVASFDAANMAFTGSNSTTYSRSKTNDVAADIVYSKLAQVASSPYSNRLLHNKADDYLGQGTPDGGDKLVFNSKTYTRCPDFDYHTKQRGTIVLWGNEHGPQSDPAECAITLYRMAKDLALGCRNNPFLSWLKENFMFVFVPCLNPYGLQNHTRNNGNNVNINRNYSTPGWAVVADTDKGSYAGDQSETQYIMNLVATFSPKVAIDIHCLGYVNTSNSGRVHYEGYIPDKVKLNSAIDTLLGFSFSLTSYGVASPSTKSQGSDWINYQGVAGGLIEMNAGPYAVDGGDGKQHSATIMEADYTLLLNMIRVWLQGTDASLDPSQLHLN